MNRLANDPPSPQPTESSFCALGRYAKLSLLLSNYKYCHKPTIRAHNIPPAPSRSSYMNTSYCGPLTFASAACRPKADSYSRASRQLRPSPCIVRRLPSTIWRIMLKRTAIQYPSVHVSIYSRTPMKLGNTAQAYGPTTYLWVAGCMTPQGDFFTLLDFTKSSAVNTLSYIYLSIISTTLIKSALLSSDTIPLPAATIHRHFSNNPNTVIIIIIKWLLLLRYIINCISH